MTRFVPTNPRPVAFGDLDNAGMPVVVRATPKKIIATIFLRF